MANDHWDPFQDLLDLQKRMNRLFEVALTGTIPEDQTGPVGWKPLADVYETEDSLVIRLELAGLGREDIQIEVEDGQLTIRGNRSPSREVDTGRYHRLERAYGPFYRQFHLPDSVVREDISAQFRNGVLTATLPKRPQDRPSHIRVKVG